ARELLHGNQHFVEEVLHRLQGAPRPVIEAIRRVPWEQESDLPTDVSGEAGYVVHCVEIAFWCGMHRSSLEEALIFLAEAGGDTDTKEGDRKSTRLNSSHVKISYAVFCLKKKKHQQTWPSR